MPVNNHNLAMVAVQGMVDIGKTQGVEFVYLHAQRPAGVQMARAQRPVVRCVAETVEEHAHLDAFLHLARQDGKEGTRYAVVPKVEILHVDGVAGLTDGCKQVVKLGLPRREKHHAVVVRKAYAVIAAKHADNSRVGPPATVRSQAREPCCQHHPHKDKAPHQNIVLNESTMPSKRFSPSTTSTECILF